MKNQRKGHWKQWNLGNQRLHSFSPPPVFLCTKRSSARVKGEPENARRQHFEQLQITFLFRDLPLETVSPQQRAPAVMAADLRDCCLFWGSSHWDEAASPQCPVWRGAEPFPGLVLSLLKLHKQIILHLESQSLDEFSIYFLRPNPPLFTISSPWESRPAPFFCLSLAASTPISR